MYQPMLFIHWKQAQYLLIPCVVAAFALPLLAVQGLGVPADGGAVSLDAYRAFTETPFWLPLFPVVAALTGAALALTAWNWDHQLNHVYALSLPLARWEYALLKMGAGMTLVLIPCAALWVGAHVAALSVALPEGLRAYPNQLAIRFFLAVVLSYGMLFALAAGTIKTTASMAFAVVATIAFLGLGGLILSTAPDFEDTSMIMPVIRWLMSARGPFEVFTGSWMLIDV